MSRGPLFALAALAGFAWAFAGAMVSPLICAVRQRHAPERGPLGLRCSVCEEPLADLAEAGLMDGGAYVRPERYQ